MVISLEDEGVGWWVCMCVCSFIPRRNVSYNTWIRYRDNWVLYIRGQSLIGLVCARQEELCVFTRE